LLKDICPFVLVSLPPKRYDWAFFMKKNTKTKPCQVLAYLVENSVYVDGEFYHENTLEEMCIDLQISELNVLKQLVILNSLGEISFGFDYENLQFNQIFVQVNLDLIIDTYERLD
jgi:hypothetical protein